MARLLLSIFGLAAAAPLSRLSITTHATGEIVRGVNLGGWLVMEPWITPSIFEAVNQQLPGFNNTYPIVDEWTFWQFGLAAQGIDLPQFIKQHWDTWILEQHLAQVAAAGITHVRIPVGYWLFDIEDGEPWTNGAQMFPYALERLKLLCNVWAKRQNLKVLFDLHGAPGSQNGFDNSGRRGSINILQGDNLERTKRIVQKMSKWVQDKIEPSVVFGIEVLNEPMTQDGTVGPQLWRAVLDDLYPNSYPLVRNATNNDERIGYVLQTAFQPLSNYAGHFLESQGFTNVWLDDHNYQAFGDYNNWAVQPNWRFRHLNESCAQQPRYAATPLYTFTGEFSLATSDCTKWLLGIGRLPSLAQINQTLCDYFNRAPEFIDAEQRAFLREFASVQMDTFEKANGWFFWTIRTEQSPEWDFLVGLREGWIPNPLSNRPPFQCP